jgi:aspartyl-tRNA(Asn)/glutamyl-tRNA(Gln) amidotransferase subunit C
MVLSLEEVEHIAELARLELTDEEKARYQEQLSAILDYAARLQVLDTTEISPQTSSILPAHPRFAPSLRAPAAQGQEGKRAGSVLRPDRARPGLSLDDLLRNAPQAEKNQFRVPPVFE